MEANDAIPPAQQIDDFSILHFRCTISQSVQQRAATVNNSPFTQNTMRFFVREVYGDVGYKTVEL